MISSSSLTLFQDGNELCQVQRVEGLPSGQCAWFGLSAMPKRNRYYALVTRIRPKIGPEVVHCLSGFGELLPISIRHVTPVEGGFLVNVEIAVTVLRARGLGNNFSVRLAA